MLFHNRLYVDEVLSKTKRKVLKNLKQGNIQLDVFVITIAACESDMLDIYPSYVLLQDFYKNSNVTVVGLASDIESAKNLLVTITDDCIRETGNVDLRKFFEIGV